MSKHRNCTGNSSDKKPKCSDTPQTNVPTPRPVIIPTKGLVAGFAAERIPKGGAGWIEICGFHTFDEGLSFYKMLDGFTTHAHALGLMPSVLDRMLVMIAPDYTYIYANNSLPLLGKMRVKEGCKKGGIIGSDNLVDIAQLEFCGISPPEKSGFMLLVSAGWRRGMCFDFRPLQPDTQISTQASFEFIKRLGAIVLTHLWFTDKFLLTADDWDKVIESGWFPFMLLPVALWEKLLDGIRHNEHLDEQEEAIHKLLVWPLLSPALRGCFVRRLGS